MFQVPEEFKKPVEKASFVANAAREKGKCRAFLAPALLSLLPGEVKGEWTSIQTRLVVLGLDEKPVEVLFLESNFDRIRLLLEAGGVPVSLSQDECREARKQVPQVIPVESKVKLETRAGPLVTVEKKKKPSTGKKRGPKPKKAATATKKEE